MTSRGAQRVAFLASEAEAAQQAIVELRQRYGTVDPREAEIIVPLGGDGFMLETVHRFVGSGVPIFGMHRGSVGFLMNSYRLDGLHERLAVAQPVELHPLEMAAWQNGTCRRAIDFTEVRDVTSVEIYENRDVAMTVLFDHEANLEERVLKEQFLS